MYDRQLEITHEREGSNDAEKGADVTGSFLELQGAQNIMYEPWDDVSGISFIHNKRKSDWSHKNKDTR